MSSRATGKEKIGRPLHPVDQKVVEGMATVGATNAEIGDFVGCDGDTIGRRFAEVLTKARAGMRLRLRQAQFKAAVGGNATMLIWLGKQMLEQKDRQELTGKDGASLPPSNITVRLVAPK